MKRNIFRAISLFLLFSFVVVFSTPVSSLDYPNAPSTDKAKCVYFYNLDTKNIIIKKGGGVPISPASSS